MSIADISLTAGIRANLFSLKDVSNLRSKTQERLATGKRVNSALDNPTNFFAARSHLSRAEDLNVYKDGIKEAIQVVKTADHGMTAMTSVFRQASAIAENAMQAKSFSELQNYVDQFNEMRTQADSLSADSGYRGTNLLHREDLTVNFGNDHSLTIAGSDVTSSGFDQMTNGLGVEEASMDPLNIVDPNYVMNTSGEIKQDGFLTITNNDVPDIDIWLGETGIRQQVITSQDVTLTTSTTLMDGRTVTSQMLDNVGVAEFGTASFDIYRDTTATSAVTVGSGTVTSTAVLDVNDVSVFLGPLLSDGDRPFTLERDLSADTTVLSGTATVDSTTLTNPADVISYLGPLAGSGSESIQVYRDISASAAVAGDPAAVSGTVIQNLSEVVDFMGQQEDSATDSFQLYRDMKFASYIDGSQAEIETTTVVDRAAVGTFWGPTEWFDTKEFSLYRDIVLEHTVSSITGSLTNLTNVSSSDIADFLGATEDANDKEITLTYSVDSGWQSSDVSSINNIGGSPPSSIEIDLVGNGVSITSDMSGAWTEGDTISITTAVTSWKSNNTSVNVAASGGQLGLDLDNSGTSDVVISLTNLQKADTTIDISALISAWKSTNTNVVVGVTGTDISLDLNNSGSTDLLVSLSSLQKPDAIIDVNALVSSWKTDVAGATVVTSGTSLMLDLSGNGSPDLTVNLDALVKADVRLSTTAFLSDWHSDVYSDITVTPAAGNRLNVDLLKDGTSDLQLTLSSLLYGDAQITVAPESSIWKTTNSEVQLNQPTAGSKMTADLNGDGAADIEIGLPDGTSDDTAWLSIERVDVATTGPFRTTDPTVSLDYDHDLKTIALSLAGGGGGTDITINLSDIWAVNHLPTDPTGNGDNINLTVDGRHRWVKGDGVTPNAPGMRLSMSEIEDAVNRMRLLSAQNSSSMSILTVRDEFISNLSNVLETGADNLTLADMNEEGANMLMLQTRENLSITALSLSAQASQSVMRLF